MSKKLIAACMAIAAFAALAVASTASAAPVLTHPTGTVMSVHPTGKTCTEDPTGCIKGTNTGETTMVSALGTVRCTNATMTGTLDTNSTASGSKGTVTSASFSGTGTNGECTSWTGGVTVTPGVAGGLPWCLEATGSTDEGKIRGGKCSELARSIRYTLDFTTITSGPCNYVRSNPAVVTFVTHPEAAKVSLTNQVWTAEPGNPIGCPSSGELNMTFDLYTDNNNEPLYFSS